MRVIEPLVFLERTVEQTLDQFPVLAGVFVRRGTPASAARWPGSTR